MCEIRCDGLRVAYLVFVLLHVDSVLGFVNDELVNELYTMYRDAVNSEPSSSQRRLFRNNKEYNLHVERLKEVNGFKKHNLIIKEVLRSGTDSIIYINNPVESKVPNAYLTLEEFKKILSERVKKEQDSFEISTKYKTSEAKKIANTFYNTLTTSNPSNTKGRVYKTISNKEDTTKIKNKPPTEELKPKSLKFNTSGFPINVPTRTSTTKTTTNNIDKSVDKNVTETQSENTSIDHQINTTPGIFTIVNYTIKEDDNNVTQNTIREENTHLEENNDDKSNNSTLALQFITDDHTEEPSRSVVVEEITEEIQPDISTVTNTETTTFSTTTTRSRKLDRPRVFVGR